MNAIPTATATAPIGGRREDRNPMRPWERAPTHCEASIEARKAL